MTNLLTRLRQFVLPKEFRIPRLSSPNCIRETLAEASDLEHEKILASETERERIAFLVDLSTGIWRLRQKMLEPGTQRPLEKFCREYRHLQSVWDVLTQAGLEILDHTGKPFDSGQAIKVIAFQPTPGVARERVQETIKPTIIFKGKHIQMGEVIVAAPEKRESGAAGLQPPSRGVPQP